MLYTQFRCIAYNSFGTNISSPGGVSVTVLPVPTNGQWTVNFCVTSINNGGTGLPYVGHGVLVGPNGAVPGTYWNALSGSQLTSSTSYRDNGVNRERHHLWFDRLSWKLFQSGKLPGK